MALNKFMHPRNKYKVPPDFVQLAKTYQEFSDVTKKDVTGKISIDFKDPHCLRVLTRCLLKMDFNLDVVIPPDRLVPTLPLRLNYILWIEDLLNSVNQNNDIVGLDIGTGACAIYPLLGATKNKWHMIATESDKQSIQTAQLNITNNNLQTLITLKKNTTSTILTQVLEEEKDKRIHFSMCNPPFYSNLQELYESRSPARLPPKNGFTGSPQELITDGGELTFCRKMIEESNNYRNNVLIFTTMVGHKYNLKELEQDLNSDGIKNTSTEFCQGRVTRWGLAWTYQDYNLSQLVPSRDKSRKKNVPIAYSLPEIPDVPYNLDTVTKKLISMFQILTIEYKVINKRGNNIIMDIKAFSNTWSNQRRKRRQMNRLDIDNNIKRQKTEHAGSNVKDAKLPVPGNSIEVSDSEFELETKIVAVNTDMNSSLCDSESTISHDIVDGKQCNSTNSDYSNIAETRILPSQDAVEPGNITDKHNVDANMPDERDPVVHSVLKVVKSGNNIMLEMEYLSGTAGKEGLHQIVQYIKNNWK